MEKSMKCPPIIWLFQHSDGVPQLHEFTLLDFCSLYISHERTMFIPIQGLKSKHGLVIRQLEPTEINKTLEDFKDESFFNSSNNYFFGNAGHPADQTVFTSHQMGLSYYQKEIEKLAITLGNNAKEYQIQLKQMEKKEKKAEAKAKLETDKIKAAEEKRKRKASKVTNIDEMKKQKEKDKKEKKSD